MKSLSKKAIVVSIIALVTIPSAVYAGWNYTHQPQIESEKPTVAAKEIISEQPQKQEEASKPVDIVTPNQVQQPTAAAPEPNLAEPVLSTKEYANKYLKMTKASETDRNTPDECLNAIINLWPDRFSENVREKNIKALRFYERDGRMTICSSGIMETIQGKVPPYTVPIITYGHNGEYFDSQTAQNYQY